MEGNTEQLSSDRDVSFLSFLDAYKSLSSLYPEIPEGYFDGKKDIFERPKPKKKSIYPFIRRKDLNNDPNDWFEDNRPKNAWEIGVKVEF